MRGLKQLDPPTRCPDGNYGALRLQLTPEDTRWNGSRGTMRERWEDRFPESRLPPVFGFRPWISRFAVGEPRRWERSCVGAWWRGALGCVLTTPSNVTI